ncbi:WS/DGAT/MGAT family O-acyltransferase [Skermania piniformis]|uniref:Diacylglycerol O-acyltransferase n=1 Tax=Skermania pinensis TaxID=39122 RepID=A0ABX8S8C0_9ACTN|nr:wax ester/triacylglycerol synthase family O-acyltransferase [Skermania piniformis]QXQ13247.1 wax ester/triacylglycerol synthase family O-acyltransferase [Skermania piniformis]
MAITRLTPQDASFYAMDAGVHPMYIGSLAILDNDDGALDYDRLSAIVERRLSLVPRYRRKVRPVPFGLARPVWVDDGDFDIGFHIRRAALPRPGNDARLHERVAQLSARRLDRARPLWEMYLIEGLSGGRCAIFTKSHAALVDGDEALEIGHVILDSGAVPRPVADDLWLPDDQPSDAELALDALGRLARDPGEGVELVRRVVGDVRDAVDATARSVGRFASVARSVPPLAPLNGPISRERRFDVARTDLADYRTIRRGLGCSINDAILAVITGALRSWLVSRREPLTGSTVVRAVVPMSVYLAEPASTSASEVSSFRIDLPVGEPNPVIRLSHIGHATEAHAHLRRGVTARTLVRLSGFAPASLHALSVRSASSFGPHSFNLVITNAPGPQNPMYIGGARMLEMYPVSPLLRDQALSIGLTSYDGKVYYGLNADRASVGDLGVLPGLLSESMEEMLHACA